jgi:NAD+ kinase
MKRVGIIVKKKPEALRILPEVALWLSTQGIEVWVEEEIGKLFSLRGLPPEELKNKVDLALVLGGDGTMLAAVRIFAGSEVPILGVNLGGLGFLTAFSKEELFPSLKRVLEGNFQVERRSLLKVEVECYPDKEFLALNDVVINKGALARMIYITAKVDGSFLTVFRGDGLIISTPTGSTAYCLSAGGPIVDPRIEAIVIVPICPHTLTNRPLLIPDSSTISLFHSSGGEEVYLTLDGQIGFKLPARTLVNVSRARGSDVILVKCPFRSYYDLLRNKLKWGGDILDSSSGGKGCF